MAQPTLPILSGAAKISFFDRINGKKTDIRLRKSIFFQKRPVNPTDSSFVLYAVALVWKSQVQRQSSPPHGGDWRKHGETTNVEPRSPVFGLSICQYIANT